MTRKMLILIGTIGGMLAMAGLCYAVKVDGYCCIPSKPTGPFGVKS